MPKSEPTTHKEFAESVVAIVLGAVALMQPRTADDMKRVERLASAILETHTSAYIERTIASAVATADQKLGEL